MSASPAVLKPTELKLPSDAQLEACPEEDLVDNLITYLDQELTPTDRDSTDGSTKKLLSVEGRSEATALTPASVSSINAEWKRLSNPAKGNSSSSTAALEKFPIQTQPRRKQKLSDVDLVLQPSQVEELLTQNSVFELNSGMSVTKTKTSKKSTSASSVVPVQTVGVQPLALASPAGPRPLPLRPRRASWWDGFKTCLNPVMGYLKNEKKPVEKRADYEIPFADIRELDFIGSGSQGAVFVGEYLGEKVAVKKVKDINYCQEAVHMRKLSHPNIVKFRYGIGISLSQHK